ncbi:hypothetical protein D9615_009097 [Tricholomella constricta]|uniref:Type 1 phosphatases regulator n=1 Tax=Tricholomella constricta TaxID=117010 RepID=A0A8H5LYS3_9AGAR|nr:hypothetical protein D9615_009097 [Tricholomella constricta]
MAATPSTSNPGDGSRTTTVADAAPRQANASNARQGATIGTLRLRGGPRNKQRVAWDEDVVDNEGCGRKSSKICCIYNKPRKFDESSSEEDSDSDSDLDSACDNHSHHHHSHQHSQHDGPGGSGLQMRPDQSGNVCQLKKKPERNAYETMPSSSKKGGKRTGA